ncbi:helix-turn-helix domain-containing protein [Clostridium saccharoperbutylacetonicum]|uniref:helix-turn-helix domain-containing protein n=1 Tax=Clostridium saccharoperbutylacetonicum TaxID=36745 RepID=UPI0039EA32A4
MFKQLREKTGYTIERVAQVLDISKSALYKYEEFHLLPSPNILLKMCEVYNCSYEEIMLSYKLAKGVYDERRAKKAT